MRFYQLFFTVVLFLALNGCAKQPPASTPLETLKAYTTAYKKKDTTTMKILLSDQSIKMAEQEAKSQNLTLDDIVERETLFNPSQTSLKYRNVKVEGEKATIEVENSFGGYDTIPFVLEEGVWKLDKQGYANQMIQQIDEQQNKRFDELINQDRQP